MMYFLLFIVSICCSLPQYLLRTSQQAYPSIVEANGRVEQSAQLLLDLSVQCIRDVCVDLAERRAASLVAFGIANQRASFVTWQRSTGHVLHDFISWQDSRASDVAERMNACVTMRGFRAAMSALSALSGSERFGAASQMHFDTAMCSVRLRWVLDNVDGAARLLDEEDLCFGTMDAFLVWQLSAERNVFTEASNFSTTGLYDPFADAKSIVCNSAFFNLPEHIMPEVRDSFDRFGTLRAAVLGSRASVPISAVLGDQQAALYAHHCRERGDAKLTMGTGMMLNVVVGDAALRPSGGAYPLVAWRIASKNTFMLEATARTCGQLIEWGRTSLRLYADASESAAIAESVSDCDGCTVVPALCGLGAPHLDTNHTKAAIVGLSSATSNAQVTRALLEALVWRANELVEVIERDNGIGVAELRIDGGVSRNRFIQRALAQTTERAVVVPSTHEMTARGVCMLIRDCTPELKPAARGNTDGEGAGDTRLEYPLADAHKVFRDERALADGYARYRAALRCTQEYNGACAAMSSNKY